MSVPKLSGLLCSRFYKLSKQKTYSEFVSGLIEGTFSSCRLTHVTVFPPHVQSWGHCARTTLAKTKNQIMSPFLSSYFRLFSPLGSSFFESLLYILFVLYFFSKKKLFCMC